MRGSNFPLDPGNVSVAAPYFIGASTGVLTGLVAGNPIFTLVNLGRFSDVGVLMNAPLIVTQIRVKLSPTTAVTTGGFAVYKATVATQRNAGAGAAAGPAAIRRAGPTQYPDIALTEVNSWVAGTGATSGGAVTLITAGAPLDCTDGTYGLTWMPSDLCPLILEQGQGLEVQSITALTGTGVASIIVDFLRQ